MRDPQAAYIDMAQLRAALGQAGVDPDVVWAKLAAMAEGARIASRSSLAGTQTRQAVARRTAGRAGSSLA